MEPKQENIRERLEKAAKPDANQTKVLPSDDPYTSVVELAVDGARVEKAIKGRGFTSPASR